MHCLKYNITHSFHPCQVQWNAGNSYSSDCYSYQIKALDKALSISGHMMWLFFDRLRSRGEAVLFTSIVIKSQGQVIPAKFIIWLKKRKNKIDKQNTARGKRYRHLSYVEVRKCSKCVCTEAAHI